MAPGWLTRSLADVPAGDGWLGARERRVDAGLRIDARRRSWRLGRWAAKAAVAAWLDVTPERIEILAAPDGAPQAWLDGEHAPVAMSLSHRAGRALAVAAGDGCALGCDLELVEPRSDAFVREWLAPAEQARVASLAGDERAQMANLLWAAKEAAAKVRREGLRLDVRHALADVAETADAEGGWLPLRVVWAEGVRTCGWWRHDPPWVMVIAGDPDTGPPRALVDRDGAERGRLP